MKKLFKKSLSLLIVFVMLFTCAPYSSAQESTNLETQNSAEFSGGTGLNPMVQTLSAEDENGYSIVSAEMQGKTATVELNNKTACTLVVAVYEEGSTHMLGCAVEDIEPGAGIVTATVDVDTLPQYYIAKVYLLNSGYTSLSGEEFMLCEPYTYNGKTKAYEQFLAKEPEDFGGEDILVFDDSKERTDFAVFTDDVILSADSDQIEFTYNEETSTYTFTKAPGDLASLNPGDIYYYQYGEASNEFLLFKVKSVTASGSTVTVQADTDFGIGEAFDFVRVDADADFSGVDDSDMTFGEGYTQVEESGEIALMSETDVPEKFVYATALSINFSLGSAASLSAEIGFAASAGSRLYYDIELFGTDFYEFKSSYSFTLNIFSITAKGKISLPEDKYKITSPAIPIGPFGLTFSVEPVLELSGNISGSLRYVNTVVVTADNTRGVNRLVDEDHGFEMPVEVEFALKVGLQVEIKLGWKELVNLKLDPSAVVQFSGEPDTVGINDDTHHSCMVCIEGEADFIVGGSLSLNITIIPKTMDFSWNIIALTWSFDLYDFYISKTEQGIKFGKGKCPNIAYKAIINVLDESGHEINGATVACASGICDADGDGVYAETSITNILGVAVFYLKEGNHSISVVHPKYITKNATVNMLAVPKSFNITMQEKKSGEVTVTVKDTNGYVLSGAKVSVLGCDENEGEEHTATTGYDGYVTFNLFPGEYNITASKDGYNSSTLYSVSIKSGTNLEITVSTDDIILFGSYPQTEVTDSQLLAALNFLPLNWKSYGYYIGTAQKENPTQQSDFMKYADVTYNGEKYRAVKFTHTRPYSTDVTLDEKQFWYKNNTVYWFKYEPIAWKVDNETDYLICNRAIDAQPYSNIAIEYKPNPDEFQYDSSAVPGYYNSTHLTNFASDYETSSIREWLNKDFYYTAFTNDERSMIRGTEIDVLSYNCAYDNKYGFLEWYENKTLYDKVFLLSKEEYDLNSVHINNSYITHYAYCQTPYGIGTEWNGRILRTPNDSGSVYAARNQFCSVNQIGAIIPVIKLAVSSKSSESIVSVSSADVDLQLNTGLKLKSSITEQSNEISFVTDACVPNQQYMLLNVTDYGSDFKLKADNLYYIDTVTADANGVVSVNFTQKQFAPKSTTLLIGDFGGGVETVIIKPEVNIENPSVTTINYGDTLVLHASFKNLPDGATILWTVEGTGVNISPSEDGLTCKVTSIQKGDVTVKATVVDENGEAILDVNGNEISASQQLNSKVNFWLKIVSFFKNLFRMNRIIY